MARPSTIPFSAARRVRRGLTFLEFLIAVSITAVVSLAVGVVTTSIARGMTTMNDTRSALQRALVAHSRLQAQLIPALCILEHDPTRGFAVWRHDQRANGMVNLSELCVFWFDPGGDGDIVMECVAFPDSWDETTRAAADLVLTSVDDYFQTMETQRALGYTTESVVADAVSGLTVSGTGLDLQSSNRITIDLTVGVGADTEPLLMAFGLINHRTPL